MVNMYYLLVKEDKRTIEQVPEKYRVEVQELLDLNV